VHGDIFSFIENIEHIPFIDALKLLAVRAGVDLRDQAGEKTSHLLPILEASRLHFEKNFNTSIDAKKYIHDRGVLDATISEYGVGYAKKEWRDLYDELLRNKFKEADIVESGLCIRSEDGKVYDRFRGRVMFPIKNMSGTTVGFTGRVLPEYDDGKSGKYVNTPETAVYHKSKVLFNFDKAKKYIADSREVFLLEGQMDVIMSSQAGVKNVIAVSGTAFTEDHVRMISRLADTCILAFDSDAAGQKARDRAAVMCAYGGMSVRTIVQVGKDAADIVKENPENWKNICAKNIPIIEYYANEIKSLEAMHKISYTKGIVVPYIKAISSPLERSFTIQEYARLTGIDEKAVKAEVDQYVDLQNNNTLSQDGPNAENATSTPIKKDFKSELELQIVTLCNFLKVDTPPQIELDVPLDVQDKELMQLEARQANNIEYLHDIIKRYEKLIKDEKRKMLIQEGKYEELVELDKSSK
jgi:DNA primase